MSERYLPSFPGDWPEDFPHENGNYQNQCSDCGHAFIGHKRRITCKLCSNPMTNQPASDTERAQCNLHAALDALKDGNFESATKLAESAIRIMNNNPGCGNQSEPEPPKGTCAEHRQTALELNPLCPICLLRNNNQLQADLTRLSAEREKEIHAFPQTTEDPVAVAVIARLTDTLAERDRQLAEAKADWNGLRDAVFGKTDYPCLNRAMAEEEANRIREQLADSQRQRAETERALVMATDAANKGDEARCKAGAMQDMIDDLKRQKAELEGRVRAVLGEHEDWRLTRVAWLHCLIKELRNNDEAFRLLADDDPQALLECMGEAEALARDGHDLLQSLRQSTQTEEEK